MSERQVPHPGCLAMIHDGYLGQSCTRCCDLETFAAGQPRAEVRSGGNSKRAPTSVSSVRITKRVCFSATPGERCSLVAIAANRALPSPRVS